MTPWTILNRTLIVCRAIVSRWGRPGRALARIVQRWISVLHATAYRVLPARLVTKLGGLPVLLLTTTGRKTGRPRTVPLMYLPEGDDIVVVASNGGSTARPTWFLNLRADPAAKVDLRSESRRVRAREATAEERARLWPRLASRYPSYDWYQSRTERRLEVVILEPENSSAS